MSETFDDNQGEMLDRRESAPPPWIRLLEQLVEAGVAQWDLTDRPGATATQSETNRAACRTLSHASAWRRARRR